MNVIYNANGAQVDSIKDYPIAAGTAVAAGQVVKLTAGLVVLAAADETAAILGVAVENHGTADAFNPRATGTKIKVADAPMAVYECPAPQITATGGSTSAFVASTISSSYSNDDFKGGFVKLITKGAASTITDPVGKVYPITASTAASGTLTVATGTIAGGCTAGDIFAVFPPVGLAKGNLDSGILKLVLTGAAALPLQVVGMDTERNMVQLEPSLHVLANKRA